MQQLGDVMGKANSYRYQITHRAHAGWDRVCSGTFLSANSYVPDIVDAIKINAQYFYNLVNSLNNVLISLKKDNQNFKQLIKQKRQQYYKLLQEKQKISQSCQSSSNKINVQLQELVDKALILLQCNYSNGTREYNFKHSLNKIEQYKNKSAYKQRCEYFQEQNEKLKKKLESLKKDNQSNSWSVGYWTEEYQKLQAKLIQSEKEKKKDKQSNSQSFNNLKKEYQKLQTKLIQSEKEKKKDKQSNSQSFNNLKKEYQKLQTKLIQYEKEKKILQKKNIVTKLQENEQDALQTKQEPKNQSKQNKQQIKQAPVTLSNMFEDASKVQQQPNKKKHKKNKKH